MTKCLFCKIIGGEIPSTTIYEDDEVVVIEDINPQAPTHALVLPRKHIPTTIDIGDDDLELMGLCLAASNRIAKERGIDQSGFRIVLNSGADAGQSVYHIHFHVLGGRPMRWPPG